MTRRNRIRAGPVPLRGLGRVGCGGRRPAAARHCGLPVAAPDPDLGRHRVERSVPADIASVPQVADAVRAPSSATASALPRRRPAPARPARSTSGRSHPAPRPARGAPRRLLPAPHKSGVAGPVSRHIAKRPPVPSQRSSARAQASHEVAAARSERRVAKPVDEMEVGGRDLRRRGGPRFARLPLGP